MPTSCDRTSNSGGKGTFVIFACILGLGLIRTKLAARLKIQAKMTKVPFPPGGVPGVRYAEKLSEIFYLHWERFWLVVPCL